ncbi:MAG TPA: hypothetical protein VMZ28_21450 [Kofleriaceae bacterium]|nr:hypothetical protein [Kofleriaceae bacterium]
MGLSMVRLLEADEDLPLDLRSAVQDGRLEEAGQMLVELYDLHCAEATQLVGRDVCDQVE